MVIKLSKLIIAFLLEEEKCVVVIIKPDAVAEGKVEEIKQLVSIKNTHNSNSILNENRTNLLS